MGTRSRLLLLTSAGLLILTILAGGAGWVVLERIRHGEAALRARAVERSSALEGILNGIYLSNTLARDYFADPAAAEAAGLRDQIARLETESLQKADQDNARGLRGEVADYWKVLNLMVEMARGS